jgi:glutamyl-tRNA reductase
MAEAAAGRLVIVGLDHRSASAELRERLKLDETAVPAALETLRRLGFGEAMVLSTCDRVLLAGIAPTPELGLKALAELARQAQAPESEIVARAKLYEAVDAVEHLFAVAASLESQIVGEPHVLGQLKAAHQQARELGRLGGGLEGVLQAAYACAKRVRTETAIAQQPVSMAAAAVQLARDLHGELDRVSGLILGTGDMGVLLADQLQSAGLHRLVVIARQTPRAETLARSIGCNFAALDELERVLVGADVVVACHGEGRFMLTRELMAKILRRRRRRPVFLADMAVPRDIEPGVNELDGAFLYDVDDLERVALAGQAQRGEAAENARAIVAEEAKRFARGLAERRAVPAVVALRRRFEQLRAETLKESGEAARATELLINRLLHDPSEALRRLAAEDPEAAAIAERLIRTLFRMEDEE